MKESDYMLATNVRALSIACDVLRDVLFMDDAEMAELDQIRGHLSRIRDKLFEQINTEDGDE